MVTTQLSGRALNRATLDRQLLLRRSPMPVLDAVGHLAGLQAQTPHTWYVGLWSRLARCDPREVGDLLERRQVVRIALMRSTVHLVTAADALAFRPLVQPVIERSMSGNFGRHLDGLDLGAVVAAGRAAVDQRPQTFAQLGRALARSWPDRDEAALAQAVRAWLPLVQVPPRGVWGASGPAAHASLETWLGAPVRRDYPVEEMLLRYLAAFGPATVRDMQTWSGLTRLAEVVERLRPSLATFRDEAGVELFDLPDAPRPEPDVPAPARYLYDYDNLLLSHADRSRVVTGEYRRLALDTIGPMPRAILVDGFTAGTWTMTTQKGAATLTVRPFRRLSTADTAALDTEGAALLAFAAADAGRHEIRYE
jgi:hypothetical protein